MVCRQKEVAIEGGGGTLPAAPSPPTKTEHQVYAVPVSEGGGACTTRSVSLSPVQRSSLIRSHSAMRCFQLLSGNTCTYGELLIPLPQAQTRRVQPKQIGDERLLYTLQPSDTRSHVRLPRHSRGRAPPDCVAVITSVFRPQTTETILFQGSTRVPRPRSGGAVIFLTPRSCLHFRNPHPAPLSCPTGLCSHCASHNNASGK